MKLKSYFSGTVEAAMELARKELGDEALLVNARPATSETRSLGAFEVVFGILPAIALPLVPGSSAAGGLPAERLHNLSTHRLSPPPLSPDQLSNLQLSNDVADLKREIERLVQSLRGVRPLHAPSSLLWDPPVPVKLLP